MRARTANQVLQQPFVQNIMGLSFYWCAQETKSPDFIFKLSRTVDFNYLMNRNVCKLVPPSDAIAHCIYKFRFVDSIHIVGNSNAFLKSRLVVQAYNDFSRGLLTHTPTIQELSKMVLLSLCSTDPTIVSSFKTSHGPT